ncbi:MAG TPA: hypothetical protein ENN87_01020 [Phycisphaerales bacterium]|nr:hypothetical protein [Phycisphaerales bacterium]
MRVGHNPIFRALHRLWKAIRLTEWMVRLLGLSPSQKPDDRHGVILIQLDALSYDRLVEAVRSGRMPFLRKLLAKQDYRLHRVYPGMPCNTPAAQARLFYGVGAAVSAFTFYDRQEGTLRWMFHPDDAHHVEARLSEQGRALLDEGSAYSNIFTGGAREPHFCIAALGFGEMLRRPPALGYLLLVLMQVPALVRAAAYLGLEMVLALVDCLRGIIAGHDLLRELKWIPSRVGMCVVLRELTVIGVQIDAARGLPIIHANLMGYHEQSHRRGADSRFARWTLGGMDGAIRRIWKRARSSSRRDYHICIYSDHGQENVIPYETAMGRSLQAAVSEACEDLCATRGLSRRGKSTFLERIGLRNPLNAIRLAVGRTPEEARVVTATLSPMAHVYLLDTTLRKRKADLVRTLLDRHLVPIVFEPDAPNRVIAHTAEHQWVLPDDPGPWFDRTAPYYEEMVSDFVQACVHPDAGDLILCGYQGPGKPYYSFTIESGSHGGIGPQETHAFVMLPADLSPDDNQAYFRHEQLRRIVLALLDHQDGDSAS